MADGFSLIVTGDALLNHRASVVKDRDFLAAVELLRGADVTHTQMEIILHDFEGPEMYPGAEGAWSWLRAPRYVAEELRWMGVDLVSTPSNHSFDYMYGGLRQTWASLDAAGIPHAGTGPDLAAARRPAIFDSEKARVALVSACSSFPIAARAGAARNDMQGRPGVNPLRYYHRVDRATAGQIIDLNRRLGNWVTVVDDEFTVNPAGLHNTLWRYRISDEPGISTLPDEDDMAGNLASIRQAVTLADFVIAHVHTHEWNLDDGRLSTSPAFAEIYARAAIDAGAHLVVLQGSHAPMRGIEVYKGRVIFHDPGDLCRLGTPVERQPADFYYRWGYLPKARAAEAGPVEGYAARERVWGWGDMGDKKILSPKALYAHEPGFFIPVCQVGAGNLVERVELHPATWLTGPRAQAGLPAMAGGDLAKEILEHVAELSEPYGTTIHIEGERAWIDMAAPAGEIR